MLYGQRNKDLRLDKKKVKHEIPTLGELKLKPEATRQKGPA